MKRLAAIRRAQEITDAVFAEIRQSIRPGQTEKYIQGKIKRLIVKHGGDTRMAFTPIVCSGKRTALFHGPTSKKKIQKNDIIYIDLGARYRGYCADLTRTFFLGQPPPRLLKIYKLVRAVQQKQLSLVKAGTRVADIDQQGRDLFKKHKLEKYFTHSTGHGVGLKIHQRPRLSVKSKEVLRAGQVITIEPGIYIKGLGGVRLEDMVIVTRSGYLNLSQSPK
ncbi:aminopeptidase YpdF [Candidatus Termititenax persephonae]|uniref:Aminopeptidase YpdF n=1 Tax=Candidatus Termititenax persephonae TaxID=2218525 RepID=A0A388THS6_9BACT|nr:aminopeptidase YpdF [Candidatus Termititenax persephonae]